MFYPQKRLSPQGLRIGLLGGSFNPAHPGHLAISRFALKRLGLDQIWWLVSPQNPLKAKASMAGLATRIAGARRVATDRRIVVTDIEAKFGAHFTIDTLRILRQKFPRAHFVWLMGADNLRQIPQWRQWQAIFKTMPVAVFRRPRYAAGRGHGQAAIRFSRALKPAKQAKLLAYAAPPAWVMLDNPLNTHSATAIRNRNQKS
jgi:nicotinate-nucleotide adenylyltransferase